MKNLLLIAFVIFWSHSIFAATPEQPDRNEGAYNLQGSLGLKGYDPVSYFPEGGSQATEGSSSISAEYGNVTYHFATEENRETFLDNPTKYEPTYGGWCAWAMAHNEPVIIDPTIYTLNGNRAHFFINKGAKFQFDNDLANRENDADGFWKDMSGEAPRL